MFDNITTDFLLDLKEEYGLDTDLLGICVSCRAEQEGHEPDASEDECESCGENSVYGFDELVAYTIA